jgi:transcription antitermination factor NusG
MGMIVGCQKPVVTHKLVVTGNQHSVPLYPDEQTYLEVSRQKQQGGVEGMAGNIRNKFTAREIDDQTSVKVISSDENGAMIQIIDGPMKGQSGYVAKQNLD